MYRKLVIRSLFPGIFWLLLLMTFPATALVPAPDALRKEGVRLQSGAGWAKDYRRAYKFFCLAALEGDSSAAYHLGKMYQNGLGRVTDNGRAVGWFMQAEQMGHVEAGDVLKEELKMISPEGDPNCPLVKSNPDRLTIKTWVHLLAPHYKISRDLVLSVIQVESNFNPQAKSPKNAFGLMQLTLPTAERFNVNDVWDPLQNIKGGMAYLAWLKEHYRDVKKRKPGRIRLMLAAYNAGEEAVKRYGGIPPYDETREYVRKVVRIYSKYIKARKRRYNSSPGNTRSNKVRSR